MGNSSVVQVQIELGGRDSLVEGKGVHHEVELSILPTIISGKTNAPTIMIGEMGASMILGGK